MFRKWHCYSRSIFFDMKVSKGKATIYNCKVAKNGTRKAASSRINPGYKQPATSRGAASAYWKAITSELLWFVADFLIGVGLDFFGGASNEAEVKWDSVLICN
eukprot:TRINITY_DN35727_c0_g1_i1.p1 TRINITY_DN35727_c0_g1~~TRINITY_DN35727_c0_g1_i1.p1  ORF type:complete len:103 (+),score=7.05 TRINITY_DN35727_c0_g1_i1:166-474(+)